MLINAFPDCFLTQVSVLLHETLSSLLIFILASTLTAGRRGAVDLTADDGDANIWSICNTGTWFNGTDQ